MPAPDCTAGLVPLKAKGRQQPGPDSHQGLSGKRDLVYFCCLTTQQKQPLRLISAAHGRCHRGGFVPWGSAAPHPHSPSWSQAGWGRAQ